MASVDFDLVVKIGSMALIRQEDNDIDYNIIARLAKSLRPGCILVSSGATEIGRIDYMKRNNGAELRGDVEEIKTDYAAQGQAILMEEYRRFITPSYSVRQVLVEHSHFNDPEKAEHIRRVLFRAANQNAIPIVNYNDPVSNRESMKMEIAALRRKNGESEVVECIDNDETAAVIARLVNARLLVLLTSVDGIYRDAKDPSTLIERISAPTAGEMDAKLDSMLQYCKGSSRAGSQGASSKLIFAKRAIEHGATVIIANARYRLEEVIEGCVPRTVVSVES